MRHFTVIAPLAGLVLLASSCAATPAQGPLASSIPSIPSIPSSSSPLVDPTDSPTRWTAATVGTVPAPVQDPAVNEILNGFTTWTDPGFHSTDNRALIADEWLEQDPEAGRERVACLPSMLPTVVREISEFPAFAFSGDGVLPGLVVDGSAVATGDLRAIPLERAPFTLRSSLATANPTVELARPDSGTIAEAVSTLKRDSDPRLGNIDVTAADIVYNSTETHSFEQSSLDLGVSLRYRSRLVNAGLDADYAQERSTERHTITVHLTQRQLTLSIVDDFVRRPGDYFAPSASAASVTDSMQRGTINADNPPMLIDRVAYGRVMHFTMSSTSVSSAQELQLAIDAVKGSYAGAVDVDARHLAVINSSQISMVAYGGDQDLALSAIRSRNLGDFFGPSNPSSAAPLTFGLRTLDGAAVNVAETADIQQLACSRTASPHAFALEIDQVQGRLRVFVNDAEVTEVTDDNPLIGKKRDGSGTLGGETLNGLLDPGKNEIELRYTNLGCDARCRVRVYDGPSGSDSADAVETFSHPTAGRCFGDGNLSLSFTIDTATGSVEQLS